MALVGAGVGMLITIHVTRYNHLIKAKHKFAASFADELATLKSGKIGDNCNTMFMINNAFEKHCRAYVEYWSVLSWLGKRSLATKWGEYLHGKGEHHNKEKFIYLVPVKGKDESKVIEIAINHIESLIS